VIFATTRGSRQDCDENIVETGLLVLESEKYHPNFIFRTDQIASGTMTSMHIMFLNYYSNVQYEHALCHSWSELPCWPTKISAY
jgi:hypothetical protein